MGLEALQARALAGLAGATISANAFPDVPGKTRIPVRADCSQDNLGSVPTRIQWEKLRLCPEVGAQSLRCSLRTRTSGCVGEKTPVGVAEAVTLLAEASAVCRAEGLRGTDPPFWAGQGFPAAGRTVRHNDLTPSGRPTGKIECGVGGDSDGRQGMAIRAPSALQQLR